MLYRIDAEAHTARLHPGDSLGQAQALERLAGDTADRLVGLGMVREAAALRQESSALAEAARRYEPEDVRRHAIVVERLVRVLDDRLPGHEIAH